jgi:hypothetical protein
MGPKDLDSLGFVVADDRPPLNNSVDLTVISVDGDSFYLTRRALRTGVELYFHPLNSNSLYLPLSRHPFNLMDISTRSYPIVVLHRAARKIVTWSSAEILRSIHDWVL